MSHVKGQLSWSWLILGNYLATLSHHHSMNNPALETPPKTLTCIYPSRSCQLAANGYDQCYLHSRQLSVFGKTLWFYVCELPVDRCHMTTASSFWNSEHLFAQSFKNCELVFSHRSKLCIGILLEFQNCESVFPPPQSPSTKYRCSPSINYCYTSVFFSSAFYG